MLKPIALFISLLLLSSSCLHNKIRYIIEDDEVPGIVTEYPNKPPEYFIKQKDILYIKISSGNEDINKILNIESNQMNSMNDIEGNPFYLNGINVNDSGNIVLPVIGTFHVEGEKTEHVQMMIQQKVDERMNNTQVKVSLVSFNLTFLGEFNKQGK
jgi:protein involved in polysaccharide export with SLBB domain